MKKIILSAVFAALTLPVLASAATVTVYPNTTTEASYHDTVIKDADRILALQGLNGGWGWDVTGQTASSTSTYLNVTGVTAEVLLSAYKITGDSTYLAAAKRAGDYIVSTTDAATTKSINGYNLLFLQELSAISGDTSYATKAANYFNTLYSITPTARCASGCVDSNGVYAGDVAYRGWSTTTPNGIPAWDLEPFVEYTKAVGDTVHAQELEAIIVDNLSVATSSMANYGLGIASGLKAATVVGDTANQALYSSLLTSTDGSYGTSADGQIQTTAYVLKAFNQAGDSRITAAANYLVSKFSPPGATNGWYETDGAANATEYAEDDSEAASAIALLLPAEIRYYSIQSAIDAANDGDTVNLSSGEYDLTAQLNVGKAVTLTGNSSTVKAISDFGTNDASKHILDVTAGTSSAPVSVSGIVFDCNSKCYGVQSYGDIYTNFSNVSIKNSKGAGLTVNGSTVSVANISTSGNAWGGINVDSGIGVTSTSTLVVNGTSSHTELPAIWIDDVTKPSVVTDTNNQYSSQTYVHNTSVTGRIYGLKTVTVNSETELRSALSNTLVTTIVLGQDVSLSSQLTINRSVVLDGDNHTLSASFSSASVIEITANDVTIKNLVEDAQNTTGNRGINIYQVTGILLDNVTVSNNAKNGVVVNGSTVTVNNVVTKNNGWNAIDVDLGSGVTSPANLTVNGTSVHSETKAAILIDNTTKTVSVTDTNNQYSIATSGTAAAYSLKTLNVKTSTSTSLTSTGITVEIPASTIVTGSSSWDGTISPPTATTTTITVSGFNTTVTSAIVVGSTVSDLTFDKAVKLTFAGQADKHVGWTNIAGTFAEITTVCASNDQATGDALPAGGNCKINDGADLVVWTKHFTTFSTYTQTAIPAVGGSGGGGYFAVSNTPASGVANAVTSITSTTTGTTTGKVLGEQVSATASQNHGGKVLGATAYNFGRDLHIGSRGQDVALLQQMLMDGGYMRAASSTTYFGPITKAAVIKWQAKMKLPKTGYFGRLSRALVIQ